MKGNYNSLIKEIVRIVLFEKKLYKLLDYQKIEYPKGYYILEIDKYRFMGTINYENKYCTITCYKIIKSSNDNIALKKKEDVVKDIFNLLYLTYPEIYESLKLKYN